jgi:hypothetical protein
MNAIHIACSLILPHTLSGFLQVRACMISRQEQLLTLLFLILSFVFALALVARAACTHMTILFLILSFVFALAPVTGPCRVCSW